MRDFSIRPATAADASSISDVIVRSIRLTNAKDYPPAVVERVSANFAPDRVTALLQHRRVLVTRTEDRVVGTASLQGAVVRTVFVDPNHQGRGVGAALMRAVEELARAEDIDTLAVPSSVTAEGFYRKLGYEVVRERFEGEERIIVMEKPLRRTG